MLNFTCIKKKLCYNCFYLLQGRRLTGFFTRNSLSAVIVPHPAL
ncbi:hypothetical protein TREVI0001_0377 [Treponema vincentii ATCC 35580]|uniref:Uncharacterized protein n=1 Tax=Treponema vincentii ATCC 35580 TaxID=596324 RepID=C8PTG0_9SPIR|nr:hypothetical protein TREVI0001_0377 [Treponema vincentii ATCC 35580]